MRLVLLALLCAAAPAAADEPPLDWGRFPGIRPLAPVPLATPETDPATVLAERDVAEAGVIWTGRPRDPESPLWTGISEALAPRPYVDDRSEGRRRVREGEAACLLTVRSSATRARFRTFGACEAASLDRYRHRARRQWVGGGALSVAATGGIVGGIAQATHCIGTACQAIGGSLAILSGGVLTQGILLLTQADRSRRAARAVVDRRAIRSAAVDGALPLPSPR